MQAIKADIKLPPTRSATGRRIGKNGEEVQELHFTGCNTGWAVT